MKKPALKMDYCSCIFGSLFLGVISMVNKK